MADRGSHLGSVVRVIGGEGNCERPPRAGPGRDRDGHAGERSEHGDLPGQSPRPLGDKLLALIAPGTGQGILRCLARPARTCRSQRRSRPPRSRSPQPPIAAVYNPRGGVDRPGKGNADGLAQPRPDEPHHVPASSSAESNILSTVMSKNRAIAIVLLAIGVIHPTFAVAALFAVGLLAIDLRALRIVSPDVRSGAPRDGGHGAPRPVDLECLEYRDNLRPADLQASRRHSSLRTGIPAWTRPPSRSRLSSSRPPRLGRPAGRKLICQQGARQFVQRLSG